MSIAPQIRSAADELLARLTDDLRAHVTQAVDELARTAETSEATTRAEADAAFEARLHEALDALRAEHAAAIESAQEAADEAVAAVRAEGEEAREALDAARAELAVVRAEADAALAHAETAVAQAMTEASAQAIPASAGPSALVAGPADGPPVDAPTLDRLASLARAVTAMDEAASLSEVLDALAAGLQTQAPRTAVLVFRAETARAWRRHGFADVADALDLTVSDHADLAAIVESARPALLEGRGDDEMLLGLTTLPEGETGLAVPVAIGGQVAALVYADGGPAAMPVDASDDEARDATDAAESANIEATASLGPGWAELVEVLARHAARCLEALTAMRASGYARPQRPAVVVPMPPHLRMVERPKLDTSVGDAIAQAQRVARLLVSEIRLKREDVIRQGRLAGDLATRLDGDIERARQEYLARVPEGVPGRDALFDDEVIRTLASGDASLLRRPTGS